jgi:hypothetical protein
MDLETRTDFDANTGRSAEVRGEGAPPSLLNCGLGRVGDAAALRCVSQLVSKVVDRPAAV